MKKLTFASLIATVAVSALSVLPASAVSLTGNQFGTNGIHFENDTEVRFTFNRSIGSYQSTFGIYDGNGDLIQNLFSEERPSDNPTGTPIGTPGNTVLTPFTKSFIFKAGQIYSLGLSSLFGGNSRGTVYSTNSLNSGNTQQTIFFIGAQPDAPNPLTSHFHNSPDTGRINPGSYTSVNPFQAFTIAFDDRGNRDDADYQDFILNAQAVPEPFTMMGTAIAGTAYMVARKRKQQAATKA